MKIFFTGNVSHSARQTITSWHTIFSLEMTSLHWLNVLRQLYMNKWYALLSKEMKKGVILSLLHVNVYFDVMCRSAICLQMCLTKIQFLNKFYRLHDATWWLTREKDKHHSRKQMKWCNETEKKNSEQSRANILY